MGARLEREYELLEQLGEGSFGVVSKVRRRADGAERALKQISLGQHRARIERELKAALRLDHPRLMRTDAAWIEDDTAFLVMELAQGSLEDFLGQPDHLTASWMGVLAAAEGVAWLAARGLVHRDLKPGNILLTETGPKLADFGMTRGADLGTLTATGTILGTPGYMAPEQARGEKATPASDIYALAVMLYEAVEGRLPYPEASNMGDLLLHVARAEVQPFARGAARLSEPAQVLVRRALAADPADRPADLGAWITALRADPPREGPIASNATQVFDGVAPGAPLVEDEDHGAPPERTGRQRPLVESLVRSADRASQSGARLRPHSKQTLAHGPDSRGPSKRGRLVAGLGFLGLFAVGLLSVGPPRTPPAPNPGPPPEVTPLPSAPAPTEVPAVRRWEAALSTYDAAVERLRERRIDPEGPEVNLAVEPAWIKAYEARFKTPGWAPAVATRPNPDQLNRLAEICSPHPPCRRQLQQWFRPLTEPTRELLESLDELASAHPEEARRRRREVYRTFFSPGLALYTEAAITRPEFVLAPLDGPGLPAIFRNWIGARLADLRAVAGQPDRERADEWKLAAQVADATREPGPLADFTQRLVRDLAAVRGSDGDPGTSRTLSWGAPSLAGAGQRSWSGASAALESTRLTLKKDPLRVSRIFRRAAQLERGVLVRPPSGPELREDIPELRAAAAAAASWRRPWPLHWQKIRARFPRLDQLVGWTRAGGTRDELSPRALNAASEITEVLAELELPQDLTPLSPRPEAHDSSRLHSDAFLELRAAIDATAPRILQAFPDPDLVYRRGKHTRGGDETQNAALDIQATLVGLLETEDPRLTNAISICRPLIQKVRTRLLHLASAIRATPRGYADREIQAFVLSVASLDNAGLVSELAVLPLDELLGPIESADVGVLALTLQRVRCRLVPSVPIWDHATDEPAPAAATRPECAPPAMASLAKAWAKLPGSRKATRYLETRSSQEPRSAP